MLIKEPTKSYPLQDITYYQDIIDSIEFENIKKESPLYWNNNEPNFHIINHAFQKSEHFRRNFSSFISYISYEYLLKCKDSFADPIIIMDKLSDDAQEFIVNLKSDSITRRVTLKNTMAMDTVQSWCDDHSIVKEDDLLHAASEIYTRSYFFLKNAYKSLKRKDGYMRIRATIAYVMLNENLLDTDFVSTITGSLSKSYLSDFAIECLKKRNALIDAKDRSGFVENSVFDTEEQVEEFISILSSVFYQSFSKFNYGHYYRSNSEIREIDVPFLVGFGKTLPYIVKNRLESLGY